MNPEGLPEFSIEELELWVVITRKILENYEAQHYNDSGLRYIGKLADLTDSINKLRREMEKETP